LARGRFVRAEQGIRHSRGRDPMVVFRKFFFRVFLIFALFTGFAAAGEKSTEKIVYAVSPVGKSTYNDFGVMKQDGRDVRLATFRTQAMGFDDTERITSDPDTSLPIRVERNISMWLKKEYIVEEYDQKAFRLTIKKYSGKKLVQTLTFQEKGPIYNAVLLPFFLRREPDIEVGWKKTIRIPGTFEVRLSSIDEVSVKAGKFKAYHFTSEPNKFEIWITCDEARVPVKISGRGGLGYAMEMQSREVR
jgi:hypothetical protein